MSQRPAHCTVRITCAPVPSAGCAITIHTWKRTDRLPLAAAIAKLEQAQRRALAQALHLPEIDILSRADVDWRA